MKPNQSQGPNIRGGHWRFWIAFIIAGSILVFLIALLLPREKPLPEGASATGPSQPSDVLISDARAGRRSPSQAHVGRSEPLPAESAEEMVARRAAQFERSRREVLYAIASKLNISVPGDVEQFFAVAEAGDWERLQALFKKLVAARRTQPHPPELDQLWGPVLTTFNALEEVHLWPAKEYLAYGNAILDSLKPGMVYVGGTDPGHGIPELLNETKEGEKHVVITQNGLGDGIYMDYLRFIYGDRFNLPTQEQVVGPRAICANRKITRMFGAPGRGQRSC